MEEVKISHVDVKSVMTKSNLPVGGYSVNPYVGCTHGCRYCYASFMKRFTGHSEEWGTFLDVKHWPEIKNPQKYAGQRVVIGSVTDGYLPQEEQFGNTRKLLEQLRGSGADILICTKSDLVVRDIDLLKELGQVTVSWSVNTLDENFKNDMDSAVSIKRRIAAMKQVYDAGIRTVCFVSPVFPGITDFEAIFQRVKDQCDLFWLENLNLRGGFKKTIMDYIAEKHPELLPLYDEIYNKHNRGYFESLMQKAEAMVKAHDCPFVDNEMPYGRVPQGHPVIVNYFYHEEIRGSENTGSRKKKEDKSMANYCKWNAKQDPRTELHDVLGLTGAEISINNLPAGAGVPFVHAHKKNEEIYIILSGKGYAMLDGEKVDFEAGDVIKVAPAVKRQFSAAADSPVSWACIQVRENSLEEYTGGDAIMG